MVCFLDSTLPFKDDPHKCRSAEEVGDIDLNLRHSPAHLIRRLLPYASLGKDGKTCVWQRTRLKKVWFKFRGPNKVAHIRWPSSPSRFIPMLILYHELEVHERNTRTSLELDRWSSCAPSHAACITANLLERTIGLYFSVLPSHDSLFR